MAPTKKTQVDEMDRGIYDIKSKFTFRKKTEEGLTPEIARQISKERKEPQWMFEKGLEALEIFSNSEDPEWGPDLSVVDMGKVITYIRPDADMSSNRSEVPDKIRDTSDKLGIQEAEKEMMLSGAGAQYDSEVMCHNTQQSLVDQGVIHTDFDTALKEHKDIVKKYFAKSITPRPHKYAALHYVVWPGGSFVHVPKGVDVKIPLQSCFRLNAPGVGQFEYMMIIVEDDSYCHLIEGHSAPKYDALNVHADAVEISVEEDSTLRFSTIENWSRNMYNLNLKRAVIEKNGKAEWASGSFGSAVSILYPSSVLKGEGASSGYTGISPAGRDQNLDTGTIMVHAAPRIANYVNSKSISKSGDISVYRGLVDIKENAYDSKSSVSCELLMLDNESRSDTIPVVKIANKHVDLRHEASIGRIDDQVIFYLMTRGIPEEEVKPMVARGFAEPIAKKLPMEYAVEMNNSINLELEGSIG